jgi:hypothetical protein
VRVETANWSGEGTFTQVLLGRLQEIPGIALVRVEDAPSSRSEADYNFISNEIFVVFGTRARQERTVRFGVIPRTRTVEEPTMTVRDLEQALASMTEVGAPDYADEGMLQYLRTERIVPPYQTRGYKLVELVRIYEAVANRDPVSARRTVPGQ